MNKLIAIPALALAVGLSLAACGPVKSAPEHVTPIPPASVALTPAPVSPPPPSVIRNRLCARPYGHYSAACGHSSAHPDASARTRL